MITALFSMLVPGALVVGLIVVVVRRGFQMRQLVLDGVETTGRVVRKLHHRHPRRKGAQRATRSICYSYLDANGNEHEHRSLVTDSFWNGLEEGGAIAIVYSLNQPHTSAPLHLVEQSRAALAHKESIRRKPKG